MFLLDDILFAPVKGLGFVFRSIHEAADGEVDDEREVLKARLNELYMMLEVGDLSEDEFDEEEERILDRLDELDELEEP